MNYNQKNELFFFMDINHIYQEIIIAVVKKKKKRITLVFKNKLNHLLTVMRKQGK